ncbi:uncharacterized protein LOC111252440 isoform X3 [Varroa destructor]|uniref:Lysosomal-trafficking regulator n=1 Tax=Varroa destructor TaxID=109461 RepID=A0A7M7KHH5_VARDE|nr:uncharacterized protein LOC111252440 isoform X3 [Varroa destructor]
MDEDDEASLHRLWSLIIVGLSAKSSDCPEQVHVFSCKFLSAHIRGYLSDPLSWSKAVSIASYVLVNRLRTEKDPASDPVCWKLLVMLKLIGVTHLPFKVELLEAIEGVWKSLIEQVHFEEHATWQSPYPALVKADTSSLSPLVNAMLPPRKGSRVDKPALIDTHHRRRSMNHRKKKDPEIEEFTFTSSSEGELPSIKGPPLSLEERRADNPDTSSVENDLTEHEAQLYSTYLPKKDFAALLLDVLDCVYQTEPHFGRIVFYGTTDKHFLLISLRLLLRQILIEKGDGIGIDWLGSLLSCLKNQQDATFRQECVTVLLTIAYHLVSNSGPEFKSNLLTVLVKINELEDDLFVIEKHCAILAEVAICLKQLRLKSGRHSDVFHHTDSYGVPFGAQSKQHVCVAAKICERLIRLVARFSLVALHELRRVAYCCCYPPVGPLLELFQRISDGERLYVLEALEAFHRRTGSCRVCSNRLNSVSSATYARVLFSTRSRELASHLAVVASLSNVDARTELYEKIVMSAFTSFLGLDDLPLVFPLLGSLFDTLPSLPTEFFDKKEHVELLSTFLFVSDLASRVVSMRLFETIISGSLVALETFMNIIEDEMNNCLKQKSDLTMEPIADLLETFHKANVLCVKEYYIRSRFQFLDTSYRLLLNLLADATTNVAYQICDILLAMLLFLCPLQLWSDCERPLERAEICKQIYNAIPKDRDNYAKIALLITTNIYNRIGKAHTDSRFVEAPHDAAHGSASTDAAQNGGEPEGYEADQDSDSGLDGIHKMPTGPRPAVHFEVASLCLDMAAFILTASPVAANSFTGSLRHLAMMCLQSDQLLKILLEIGSTSRLCRSYLAGYRKFGSYSDQLTEALLHLVQILCRHSITSDELFDLLQLFKVDKPAYETLLNNLNQLLYQPQGSLGYPDRVLIFRPFTREQLGPPESWLAQTKRTMLDGEGPWAEAGAAAALPLATVTDFDGVSFSLWFRADTVGTTHLVSLGNRQALLEAWLEQRLHDGQGKGFAMIRIVLSTGRPLYERLWTGTLPMLSSLPNQGGLGNWAHIYVEMSGHNKISVSTNGQKRELEGVPYRALASLEVVLLGCQVCPIRISSLMLFKGLERGDHSTVLYRLGPSYQSLVECPLSAHSRIFELQGSLRTLQRHLALAYQPTDPLRFVAYPRQSKLSVQSFFSSTRRLQHLPSEHDVFCFSMEPCVALEASHNLHVALASLGGYRVLLFLLAWVVERTNRQDLHSAALEVVLQAAESGPELQAEFQREGLGLTMLVLEYPKCQLSLLLLKMCLTHCCDATGLKLHRAELLSELLLPLWPRWREAERAQLAAFLARCTRLRNPHHIANVNQLVKVNVLDRLLNILKEEYASEQCSLSINTAEDLVELVSSMLAVTGYQHALLSSLIDFVVLLHDATRTYVVHTRNQRVAWGALPGRAHPSSMSKNEMDLTSAKETALVDGADVNDDRYDGRGEGTRSDSNGNFHLDVEENRNLIDESEQGMSASVSSACTNKGRNNPALCTFICGIYKVFCAVLQQQGGTVATLRPELLVVLANEPQHELRVAVVNCLAKFLRVDRESQKTSFASTKNSNHASTCIFGFQLLANQLSQFECCEELLLAVLQLASGRQILRLEQMDNFQQLPLGPSFAVWPEASVVLLACINRCTSADLAAKYVSTLAQVVSGCPPIARSLAYYNIVEQVCELLPYLTGALSQSLYALVRVIVALQTAQPTESRAAAASTQLAVQFYMRLYAHYVKNDPTSTSIKYIPRLYAGALHGFSDALKHNILMHITVPALLEEKPENTLNNWDYSHESEDIVTNRPNSNTCIRFPIGLAVQRDLNTAEGSRLSGALGTLTGRRGRCSPQVLERQLLLLVELLQFSRPSVLLCTEGFACLGDVLHVLAMACLQDDHPSLSKTAVYQLSNLALALLRPTLDISCRLRSADLLGRIPNLCALFPLFAANKLELLAAFVVELSEGSEGDQRTKILLNSIADSLAPDSGPFRCEMKRQKWLAQFEEDRASFLDTQATAALGASQLAASRVNLEQQHVTDAAMRVTRTIVDYQNYVRKAFLSAYKGRKCVEYELRLKWKGIAQRLTHERAVWHMPEFVPASWELDPTEGPWRMRKRLRRAHLDLEPRFWINGGTAQTKFSPPLAFLYCQHAAQREKWLHSFEQILSVHSCSMITASVETSGEVLVGLESVRFVPEDKQVGALSWAFSTITELMPRRYEHADVAVEMFLNSGLTCLLVFKNRAHRQDFYDKLTLNCDKLQKPEALQAVTARWQRRLITNFEYLTYLNKMAGRSFNNLMQYPVFPFVLSQYDEDELDLSDAKNFRVLDKPIAVQDKSREPHYVDVFRQSQENITNLSVVSGPFHYGSHYSNSGIVLHFLVRMPPFTQAFLSYQDDNFDIPDRTFHSMETTWRLASRDSPTDVKELIPEFFYFPEFLRNIFKFDFGSRQNGEQVNDVRLPPWCENDARLFNLINLAALESETVTERLNLWIDLVFGYKQQGRAAVDALNVFHPATYAHNAPPTDQMDSIALKAYRAMIKTYGQMPIQLFTQAHPNVNFSTVASTPSKTVGQRVLPTVIGVRWGVLAGSPDEANPPECIWSKAFGPPGFGRLRPLDVQRIVGVSNQAELFGGHDSPAALLSWCYCDAVLRLKTRKDLVPQPLLDAAYDPVSFVCCSTNRPELFIGHSSGRIGVFRLRVTPSISAVHLDDLIGHKDIVLHVDVCPEFFIVASSSNDGSCILWDLNSLKYVRTVLQIDGGSKLHLYTINGVFVAQLECLSRVTSLAYSSAPEGANVNLLLAGHADGSLRLFSSWNLAPVRELNPRMRSPVADAVFSICNQFIFAADQSGQVCAWAGAAHKSGTVAPPKFLQEKL